MKKLIAMITTKREPLSLKYRLLNVKSLDDIDLVETVYDPFYTGINEHHQQVKAHTEQWVLYHQMYQKSDEAFKTFCKADIATLCAYCYREESEDMLNIVTDFVSWLFCHDDFKCDPIQEVAMNRMMMGVLFTGNHPNTEAPLIQDYPLISQLASALLDIRKRLLDASPDLDMSRFTKSVNKYFKGNKGDAIKPIVEIGVLIRGLTICSDDPETVNVDDLLQQACTVICCTNDMVSLIKKSRENDIEDFVMVKREEERVSMNNELLASIQMCESEIKHFETLKNNTNKDVPLFIGLMEDGIRGHLDWSLETLRYKTSGK